MKDFKIPPDVTPTKTNLFFSGPCEVKAAKIRNETLAQMRKNDRGNVAYLLLKNKTGVRSSYIEIGLNMLYGIVPLVLLLASYGRQILKESFNSLNLAVKIIIPLQLLLIYGAIAPIFSNIRRYQQTISECEDFIDRTFDQDTAAKVKALDGKNLTKLHDILDNQGVRALLIYGDPHVKIDDPHANIENDHPSENELLFARNPSTQKKKKKAVFVTNKMMANSPFGRSRPNC